jgi:hypothetical protein
MVVLAASAAVCREETGLVRRASATVVERLMSPECLEAAAISEAFFPSGDRNATHAVVVLDNLELIKKPNNHNRFTSYGAILKEIDNNKKKLCMVSFSRP